MAGRFYFSIEILLEGYFIEGFNIGDKNPAVMSRARTRSRDVVGVICSATVVKTNEFSSIRHAGACVSFPLHFIMLVTDGHRRDKISVPETPQDFGGTPSFYVPVVSFLRVLRESDSGVTRTRGVAVVTRAEARLLLGKNEGRQAVTIRLVQCQPDVRAFKR